MVIGILSATAGEGKLKQIDYYPVVPQFYRLLRVSAALKRALPTQFSALHGVVVHPLLGESGVFLFQ